MESRVSNASRVTSGGDDARQERRQPLGSPRDHRRRVACVALRYALDRLHDRLDSGLVRIYLPWGSKWRSAERGLPTRGR